ncbi:phage tail protein [Pedobacter metabolipauper]|uniref:Microcystin-dependent protein n=1 Tax=Pedobacter metabolipauper TaxID=425513 RepID=A0A4R6SSY8_9SPHI|nr:tail fiber protein [Pedobacter metabolipauper]TDQ08056.1 microcystin-dependent protein [Pedobacter metabolipauper]
MEPFLAEIKMISFHYAPKGWAFCNGQVLTLNKDTKDLFSLIGIQFGGDGVNNFALPDLRGRVPMVNDNVNIKQGQSIGSASIKLTYKQMPLHNHQLNASTLPGSLGSGNPDNNIFGDTGDADKDYFTYPQGQSPALVTMSLKTIAEAGISDPIANLMPYLGINFIIATSGIYPQKP